MTELKRKKRGFAIGRPERKVQLNVLVAPSLIDKVRKAAMENRTSVNMEVAVRLEKSFK